MSQIDETLGGPEGGRRNLQVASPEASPLTVFLDPWLSVSGDPLAALVEDLMPLTTPHHTNRIRSERQDAIRNRHTVVSNIAANLALLALSPSREPGDLLAVSTAKTKPTRYDREDYPRRILAGTLEALERAGVLTRHPWVFKQKCTAIEPTPGFLDLLKRHEVRLQDIGRDAGGESIWLRARVDQREGTGRHPRKVPINYEETEETVRLRSEVDRLNAVLNGAGIAFDGEPAGPIALRRMFLLRSERDDMAFTLNGRLWGGFWQNLRKDRRHLITIGGHPETGLGGEKGEAEDIVDLDYSAMFASLAYLKVTGRLPSGDPYDIPGLEEHRDGAKQGLLSLLNYSGPMKSLAPKTKRLLPDGWTAWMLEGAMTDRHRPIASLFGKDVGIELMHTESRILMAVLLDLAEQGIPALPMHDGINVKASDREASMEVMHRVSQQVLGVALPVKEKAIWRPESVAGGDQMAA